MKNKNFSYDGLQKLKFVLQVCSLYKQLISVSRIPAYLQPGNSSFPQAEVSTTMWEDGVAKKLGYDLPEMRAHHE